MNKKIIRWWDEIDKVIFILSISLILIGIVLSLTGTTQIKGFEHTYFIKRHLSYAFLSILLIIFFSTQKIKTIRRICAIGLIVTIFLMFFVIVLGYEINGSKRWFPIFGFTLQPSEFLKPFFAVISGWFLSKGLFVFTQKSYLLIVTDSCLLFLSRILPL